MKTVNHSLKAVVAATAAISLGLSLSSCTNNSDTPSTPSTSDTAAATAPAPQPCELPAGSEASGPATGTHSGEDISVAPEIATGYRSGMEPVTTQNYAVATANPLASQAACAVLLEGGTAADALVAAQFTLGLTEPQSSGIGGGGYIVYYDAQKDEVSAIDARETAPVAADENYLIHVSDQDTSAPVPDARRSGRSIGVPGIVAGLGELHAEHGKTAWDQILEPTADLASAGFEISPRMSASIASSAEDLATDPEAAEYFLNEDGSAKEAGTLLKNPAYADTVREIATGGADAFYTGDIAAAIVDRATRNVEGFTPSLMSTADLAAYTPEKSEALCGPYRDRIICGMPPSSSGGIAVIETLGILDNVDLAKYAPSDVGLDGGLPNVEAIHLISEAERLAYADRDAYVGDPAFVSVPGGGIDELISPEYTRERAGQINPDTSMGEAQPGLSTAAAGPITPEHGTSHISVIDSYGNAASLTTSVEAAFGSFHFTRGFILNNQLTDFSAEPTNEAGEPVANRVESAKRPRSSMSPMLVFAGAGAAGTDSTTDRGDLEMVVGSPGGSLIIQFVVKTLVNMIDWGMDPQQAVSAPNFGAMNKPETGIGTEHPLLAEHESEIAEGLEQRGHEVNATDQSSGLSALVRSGEDIIGGADPRREGVVLGGT